MLPLMDVVFLLLVLFIFMIIRMRPDFGISVTLPEVGKAPAEAKSGKPKKQVTVSVTADNEIYVNRNATDMSSLVPEIKRGARPNEDVEIVLKGDRAADYGRALEIFHELRSAGISNVLFDVNERERSD